MKTDTTSANDTATAMSAPAPITWQIAFAYWLKLGFISFGGPAGQIAIMHADLVEKRRWISEGRFLHALNYCMVLPGPEAQQLATYIGWLMHRTWGGLMAGVLFVLPSLGILIALTWAYLVFGNQPLMVGLFDGIKPAVTAIVLHAAWRIGSKTLKNSFLWAVSGCALLAVAWFKVPFPAVILGAAMLGFAASRVRPDWFASGGHGSKGTAAHAPALIDDATPAPAHARWRPATMLWVLAVGIGLWATSFALTRNATTLSDMAGFFSKAALLTFGGAYAVLPYVADAAVNQYQWLTTAQMIDGLALGETTPGPLIMIVAFVGFVGGWGDGLMAGNALSMGILAACVATWFTFLPSFVFIFAGAPFIESTRGKLGLAAPLATISAAVVGVIVNLAIFFAAHVFFAASPNATLGSPKWAAIGIGVAAAVALFRFKVGVIPLILASGIVGVALKLALA
jgi:chromate transporter